MRKRESALERPGARWSGRVREGSSERATGSSKRSRERILPVNAPLKIPAYLNRPRLPVVRELRGSANQGENDDDVAIRGTFRVMSTKLATGNDASSFSVFNSANHFRQFP